MEATREANIPPVHYHHTSDPFMATLNRLTSVALIAFSAYSNMQLFVPSFAFGMAVGIFQVYRDQHRGNSAVIPSCAHGFLEQTSGVKLPEILSLAIGAALYIHELEHHPEMGVLVGGLIGGALCVTLLAKITKQRNHILT